METLDTGLLIEDLDSNQTINSLSIGSFLATNNSLSIENFSFDKE